MYHVPGTSSTVPTNQVLVLTALTGGTYIPTVRSEISKTNSKYSAEKAIISQSYSSGRETNFEESKFLYSKDYLIYCNVFGKMILVTNIG